MAAPSLSGCFELVYNKNSVGGLVLRSFALSAVFSASRVSAAMEVTVKQSSGIPNGCLLAIRAGTE